MSFLGGEFFDQEFKFPKNHTRTFDVLILGDSGVGKTSFCESVYSRFMIRDSVRNHTAYIVDFMVMHKRKKVQVSLSLNIFKDIHSSKQEFRKNDATILMFDLTRADTLKELPKWHNIVTTFLPSNEIFLVANKLDQPSRISSEMKMELMRKTENRYPYFAISCKTPQSTRPLFVGLLRELLNDQNLYLVDD